MLVWYWKSDVIVDVDSPTSFSHSSSSSLFVTLKSVFIFQLGRLILVDSMASPGCHPAKFAKYQCVFTYSDRNTSQHLFLVAVQYSFYMQEAVKEWLKLGKL